MKTLNSPIELGVRALILLNAAFPKGFDLSRLVLLDYCMTHSADAGGPSSVFPAVPIRAGEIGVKRTTIEHGLQVMVRGGMVDVVAAEGGLLYIASEEAGPLLTVLRSRHTEALSEVAEWVVAEFGDLTEDELRGRMNEITSPGANYVLGRSDGISGDHQ